MVASIYTSWKMCLNHNVAEEEGYRVRTLKLRFEYICLLWENMNVARGLHIR